MNSKTISQTIMIIMIMTVLMALLVDTFLLLAVIYALHASHAGIMIIPYTYQFT